MIRQQTTKQRNKKSKMSESQSIQSDFHFVPDDDGFTFKRYIEGQDRMYPSLRFEFRPVLPIQRAKIADKRNESQGEQAILSLSKVLAARVVAWSAIDRTGRKLEPRAENIARLHPTIFNRMCNIIIFQIEGGDVDPDWKELNRQVEQAEDWLGETTTGLVGEQQKN